MISVSSHVLLCLLYVVPSIPVEVEVQSVGVVTMTIGWLPPQYLRGQVHYCVQNMSETTPPIKSCTNQTSVTLSDLQPFTQYRVSVVAMTTCGTSLSVIVTNKTLPTLPGPPLEVAVVTRLPYSIHLRWLATDQPNGVVLHYNVSGGVAQ